MLETLIWAVEIAVVEREGRIVGFRIVVIFIPLMLESIADPVDKALVEIDVNVTSPLLINAEIGCPFMLDIKALPVEK